jgi:hypothetical protein
MIAGATLVVAAAMLPAFVHHSPLDYSAIPGAAWVLAGIGLYCWYRAFRS